MEEVTNDFFIFGRLVKDPVLVRILDKSPKCTFIIEVDKHAGEVETMRRHGKEYYKGTATGDNAKFLFESCGDGSGKVKRTITKVCKRFDYE